MTDKPIKVTAKRVKAGEKGTRRLAMYNFVTCEYPQDGTVIRVKTTSTNIDIYVSDSDIHKMKALKKGDDWVPLICWDAVNVDEDESLVAK